MKSLRHPFTRFRYSRTFLFVLFFGLSGLVYGQKPDDVLGVWLVAKEDAKIEIYKKADKYFGKVIWLLEPFDDQGNPITDDNGDQILYMEVMKDFEFDDDEWVDGSVYDAEEGKTYHGSIEIKDSNTIELRGSIDRFGLLGRTEEWKRVN